MHNRPGLAVGKFQIRSGAMMAGSAYFDIAVTGRGAHGARRDASIDPVVFTSHIAIVSRNVRPVYTAVVGITRFARAPPTTILERAAPGRYASDADPAPAAGSPRRRHSTMPPRSTDTFPKPASLSSRAAWAERIWVWQTRTRSRSLCSANS